MKRRAGPLETVWVEVPEDALDAYEAALSSACATVGFFLADEERRVWRVEGVRDLAAGEDGVTPALALAGQPAPSTLAGRTTFRFVRSVVAMHVISICEPPGIQSTNTVAQAGSLPAAKNSR